MKEQMISIGPPIHLLCYHPLAYRIIEKTLAPRGYRVHRFSAEQIHRFEKYEYILIIDAHSVERWLEMTLRYGFMKKQPVILLTANLNTPEEETRILCLGVRGIVPIANLENELTLAVESIIARGLWIRSNTLTEYVVQRDDSVRLSPKFTIREQQIVACLMEGFSNKEIGQILAISPRTVKFHVANILHKFNVKNRRCFVAINHSQKSEPLVKAIGA